jgi:peptidoglycan/xylan/chitin deacetylase (PgdA/CDA1 family)
MAGIALAGQTAAGWGASRRRLIKTMPAIRRAIKRRLRGAIETVAGIVAPIGWRLRRQPALVILMYHRVLPEDDARCADEQPGMWVTPATLDLHLRVLRKHFELVHLDEWLSDRAAGRALPRRACAITFDDGWRDNFQFAFPVLRRHRAPAIIFLVSDFVGKGYTFWPNQLMARLRAAAGAREVRSWPEPLASVLAGALPSAGPWPPGDGVLDYAIERCKQAFPDLQMRDWLSGLGSADSKGGRDLLDWAEIQEMADSGLVRFGSHSRRHIRLLESLDPTLIKDEVTGSRTALEARLGRSVTLFCYPNGDVSGRAESEVRREYLGAVLTTPGWNRGSTDPHRLRRVGMHECIARRPESFLARLAGWV